jgi:hypothetical protein
MSRVKRSNRLNRSNIGNRQQIEIDFGDVNNVFYKKHFVQKKDELTERFKEVMNSDYYIERLPASFIDGLPNFQEIEPLPLKTVPLFSKLIKGDYQKEWTKYDKVNIRAHIQFFTNNLPSFRRYAPTTARDKLDWVILKHRLLVIEIFEYYKDRKRKSPSTFESRFNAILRIIRIAYGNKSAPLYKLFSEIVFQLHDMILLDEGSNRLNADEAKKYVNWLDVLKIQKRMEDTFEAMEDKNTREAYDYNNDLLLLSLYCLIPPLRNEIKFLEFTRNPKNNKQDYVFVSTNMKTIILKFNLVKKLHKKVHFDITSGRLDNPHLTKIIKQSLTLYPRKYLFTVKNMYPNVNQKASARAMDSRLISIFFRNGIHNQITVNSLRSSYVSYRFSKRITYNAKLLIAHQMRTSDICLDRSYNKVLDLSPVLKDKKDKPKLNVIDEAEEMQESDQDDESQDSGEQMQESKEDKEMEAEAKEDKQRAKQPDTGLTPYQRKLIKDREYYAKHKETIRERQNEYKNKKTPFEKTRERILQLLNASSDYSSKMKDSTREKYKFIYDEAKAKWKWQE